MPKILLAARGCWINYDSKWYFEFKWPLNWIVNITIHGNIHYQLATFCRNVGPNRHTFWNWGEFTFNGKCKFGFGCLWCIFQIMQKAKYLIFLQSFSYADSKKQFCQPGLSNFDVYFIDQCSTSILRDIRTCVHLRS